MSMSHEAVARAVKKLGLNSAAQHNAGYGLPLVDVAIEGKDQDVAVMVSVLFLPDIRVPFMSTAQVCSSRFPIHKLAAGMHGTSGS